MNTGYQFDVITKIRRLRESKGMGQADIAKLLGISLGHLGNIESPKYSHKFTLKQIATICDELDYPMQKILCDDDNASVTDIINAIIKYVG